MHRASHDEAPSGEGRRVVFLIDAASALERRVLQAWIARQAAGGGNGVEAIPIPPSRRPRRRRRLDPRIEACVATDDDPLLTPLRVAWLPEEKDGVRTVGLSDLLVFGDPRDPGRVRQEWVLRRRPDRMRVIAGEAAPVSELRERWRRAGGATTTETTGLAEFDRELGE